MSYPCPNSPSGDVAEWRLTPGQARHYHARLSAYHAARSRRLAARARRYADQSIRLAWVASALWLLTVALKVFALIAGTS